MELQSLCTMQDFYGGSIHARLGVAQAEFLEKELAQTMASLELGALCTVCGAKVGGGCCSRFMAGENDVAQLLLNLMAGVPVAILREDEECCFLGERGCLLRFKPMFCLNYNCQQIRDGAGMVRMQGLEQAAGRLLQQQYGLEQLLLELLRQRGRLAG